MKINGTVKTFNDQRGFGFIEAEDGKEVFVHYSMIEGQGHKSLKPGDKVAFELYADPKEPNWYVARNVSKA